jgi:hypothetical protein
VAAIEQLMLVRIEADLTGSSHKDIPCAHVLNEDLAEDFQKAREKERQCNPLG